MNQKPADYRPAGCEACRRGDGLDFQFTMAFQPIVDIQTGSVFAHEALVRGTEGQGAGWVLDQVNDENRYRFDQSCRVKAIELAARVGMTSRLSINFLPNAVYKAELCIRTTLEAAERFAFDPRQVIFEFIEGEKIYGSKHILDILKTYQRLGFLMAIDDFGAGYAGLNLLAEFQPNLVKIDRDVARGLHRDRARLAIVRAVLQVCRELGIEVIAEGIEEMEEMRALRDLGVRYFQGYLFAKPLLEGMPPLREEAMGRS